MQPLNQSDVLKAAQSKDRAFGEYQNVPNHRCPCYPNKGMAGPLQYQPGDFYFCFSKFENPFWKPWIGRYVAMAVLFPTLDIIHQVERKLGRPLIPPEWFDIKGVITTHVPKVTPKGMYVLAKKSEGWLRGNMIDEIDHRLVRAETEYEWKGKERELLALYGDLRWARAGSKGTDWMKLHSATNTLEMLRQTDYAFCVMPPKYEEPAKEPDGGQETDRKTKAAAGALAALESIETAVVPEQEELL